MRPEDVAFRLTEIASADILWIWRAPLDPNIQTAVDAARFGGAKIVFDLDDLMVDPSLARISVIDGIRTQGLSEEAIRAHYRRIRATMATADLCVAATDELAGHMRNAGMPTRVLPNGFDWSSLMASRGAARSRRLSGGGDGLIRIGYAGGTLTHQRDFAVCASAIGDILRARRECRLVAFLSPDGTRGLLDASEFPDLSGLEDQIEWRDFVPLDQMPDELARFDVNLAPLEIGNPFCEAKSELKFFEAALVDVPTVASPSGPFARVIRHGETGFLAATPGAWREALNALVADAGLRRRIADAAYLDVLWTYGPERRSRMMDSLLDIAQGGQAAARAFQLDLLRRYAVPRASPRMPEYDTIFETASSTDARLTIAVPLYNYSQYITETLESTHAQGLSELDLVIVEDRSTDNAFEVALSWVRANASRFNRVVFARNRTNSGLALTRNAAFKIANTPYVLPLDADNRLLPSCAAACLRAIENSGAAFVYPVIQQFGQASELLGLQRYDPARLANANYIDAMALVSRAAWAAVGGYDDIKGGWEDFDLWCKFVEEGFFGAQVGGPPLAEYRVHDSSMIKAAIGRPETLRDMMADLGRRHPWLTLVWPLPPDVSPP
jgi:glycosyltransferase involved in cell wall biosynthesis